MPSWATSWRPFWKMAATAARGQFGDGSTPKCAQYILVYLCAKIGAFIKKCTICLNIIGKPPHYTECWPPAVRSHLLSSSLYHFSAEDASCSSKLTQLLKSKRLLINVVRVELLKNIAEAEADIASSLIGYSVSMFQSCTQGPITNSALCRSVCNIAHLSSTKPVISNGSEWITLADLGTELQWSLSEVCDCELISIDWGLNIY